MTIWTPDVSTHRGPRYIAIADALASDIRSNRLSPGDRLPTHRELAYQLGVTVGTVTRAYSEAERRGLIGGEVGRGTFVRSDVALRRPTPDPSIVPVAPTGDRSLIEFSVNFPTVLANGEDHDALLRTTLQELSQDVGVADLLNYQQNGGLPHHRQAGSNLLARYGVEINPDRVIVTSGAQHAMTVALAAITEPGDTVVTEALTWPGLRRLGDFLRLRIHGLQMDQHGILPDALDAACRARSVKAMYCVTNMHNPTSIVVPEQRRRELAEVARLHGVRIIEDDVYGFLVTDRPPPLVSFAPELGLFFTSVSKSMAPGLRVGYLAVMHEPNAGFNEAMRSTVWMATPLTAEIASRWIAAGQDQIIGSRRRMEYQRRQEAARRILDGLGYEGHPNAMHGWMDLPDDWPADAFALQARIRGVAVSPTSGFALARNARNGIRISLSAPSSYECVIRGLEIIANLAKEKRHGSSFGLV